MSRSRKEALYKFSVTSHYFGSHLKNHLTTRHVMKHFIVTYFSNISQGFKNSLHALTKSVVLFSFSVVKSANVLKCHFHITARHESSSDQGCYLNFYNVDCLHQFWCSSQHKSIEASSGSWYDLTTLRLHGICMNLNIIDIKSHTSHILLTKYTLQHVNVIILELSVTV